MTDQDFNSLMLQLSMLHRKKVVRALLYGNDCQCFTTEQYRMMWKRLINKGKQTFAWGDTARRHLQSVPELVREVSPDLWAPPA